MGARRGNVLWCARMLVGGAVRGAVRGLRGREVGEDVVLIVRLLCPVILCCTSVIMPALPCVVQGYPRNIST